MRRRMQGVIEFIRLSRSRSSNVADITPSLTPWKRLLEDDYKANSSMSPFSKMMMMRLNGPRFVHAAAAARARGGGVDAAGIEGNGTPPPSPPTPTPSPQPPSRGRFTNWVRLVFGSVISILVAFWMPKWTSFLKIRGKAEVVMHEIEQAAEVVEKVATVVEKVSEEVADNLPNDSKLKEAASIVEHISKEAAKDALIAQEIIHKIDDAEQDLEDVGEIIEPIIENIVHTDKSKRSS